MIHKCTYFHVVDGIRVCVQCGKPAHSGIEDKVVEQHEDKKIYPAESKRLGGGKHVVKTKQRS